MKIIRFIFAYLLIGYNVFALSFDDLEKVIISDNIQGEFKQEKIIVGFPNPVISSGKFTINNQELLWQTEKPRKSYIKINAEGIFSQSNHNQWIKIQEQYDKSIFLDIVSMNFKKISSIFSIDLSGNVDNWVMILKPKKHIVGKIFKNIVIKGNKYITSIDITEENNDKTIMTFVNVS